jgi:hypothetical protein
VNLTEEFYAVCRRALADELDARAGKGPAGVSEPELERLPDAARRFGVSVSWVEKRVREGALPLHGRGHMRRVRPAEVRALMERRNAPAANPSTHADKILRSLPGGKSR